jgi:DUF1680 family protein
MVSGAAQLVLRVRVPAWTAGTPTVVLNGTLMRDAVVANGAGDWVVVSRSWSQGDWLLVTLPMRLSFTPAPDNASVQAVTYGPVVLSGLYDASYAKSDTSGQATAPSSSGSATEAATAAPLPVLDTSSVRRTTASPMTFAAIADNKPITMVPVARAQHEPYTVYWQTRPSVG